MFLPPTAHTAQGSCFPSSPDPCAKALGIYSAGTCRGSQWNSCFLIWEKGAISTVNCREVSRKMMSVPQCWPRWGEGFKSSSDSISHPHCLDSSFSWCP